MNEGLSILVGCDDSLNLSYILKSLSGAFGCSYVSASRTSDILNIIRSIKPFMIILSFRNNQLALHNTCSFLGSQRIPILCLTGRNDSASLSWSKESIVFTLPLASSFKDDYLKIRINSIIGLTNTSHYKDQTLAQRAQQGFTADKNKELGRYILEVDQKVETLIKIRYLLLELYPEVNELMRIKLVSIVNLIKRSVGDKKRWDDFKLYFESVDSGFLKQLSEKHPSLTPKDIKYCCYLKMNMSNADIRHILGINQESVRTHKYRLKKKIALLKNQDLKNYIEGFPQMKQIS